MLLRNGIRMGQRLTLIQRHNSNVPGLRIWSNQGATMEKETRENSREEKEERDEGLQVRLDERRIGYLQRSFTFPSAVNIDALKARLRHGLLVMMVPKVTDAKDDSRRIRIED
jgi:hypothetical protein